MKVVPMKAERRTALGRNQVARLRQQGWLPAVVYGEGKESVAIAVSEWELDQHVKARRKVYQLDIQGAPQAAYLQQVSWNAVDDRPLHADFKRIDLDKPIETAVEVTLLGHPVGISKGGTLVRDSSTIVVRCLPTEIPETLEHDVGKVELDEFVSASQIALPKGVTLVSPPTMTVCHVAKLVVQAVPEAAPAAAPAEGEAAAAPAAGEAKPEDAKAAEPKKADKPEKPAKG
ncbi:MAG: 50S ribosomal protein L25 [Planctomycetes bacterium]|nr:50S ribosomal protein L25 [Planctomycetota bacterium]